ncbi:DUF3048 domain-containing protein [Nocardioides sp. R-C-SC26]|uniref:DUF3048 domain-containing protein n=1 Tax=Nocardioides sp. R-C-SC26 TaxID=2870414 RepID=UPI001E50A04F|nr:DUF3048 domain-containing protein [Nocardioides sp. R-C-SC26]
MAGTVAALALVLAGCGAASDRAARAAADGSTAQATGSSETWPLTGLPVTKGSSARSTPVLVVKMDNTRSSAPQVGLSDADLVVEELVEGGVTRLAVFYYSQMPQDAGPVRSMRASDIGIVSPVDASMVTSGAAGVTIDRIRGAGVSYFAEGDPGFYRSSSRYAPYNLFVDLQDVAKEAARTASRPVDYLPWGSGADFPSGQPAERFSVRFSGAHATEWQYSGKRYAVQNSYAASDDAFPADSVVVLRVPVGDAGYRDPAGNAVPETEFEGTGEAMIFHGGRLVRGTWEKSSLVAPIQLRTQAGALAVPAGRTWVELVPVDGGSVDVG